MRKTILCLCSIAGLALFTQGSYIKAKAQLAQYLIDRSWSSRAEQRLPSRPWPWSDTRVIAQLSMPDKGIIQYVMNDASGQALAFGPGLLSNSANPGHAGHSLIAGHRDTHFAFLQDIEVGEIVETRHFNGVHARYRVIDVSIIDAEQQQIPILDGDKLSLITCYPFNALIPRGPLRYLVTAKREQSNQQISL